MQKKHFHQMFQCRVVVYFLKQFRENPEQTFTLYSASAGAPVTVERVYFDIVPISDGFYDGGLEDSAEGGDSAQGNANHAYYLKLPSNCKRLHQTLTGELGILLTIKDYIYLAVDFS